MLSVGTEVQHIETGEVGIIVARKPGEYEVELDAGCLEWWKATVVDEPLIS
jgi:hypothetical protein